MRRHEQPPALPVDSVESQAANAVESAREPPAEPEAATAAATSSACPTMIDALWPPKPKLLLITWLMGRSCGVFGV